jgi:ABC-type bacteriocin/lantibiotic exporter with double-glycine peptidase domain
VARLLTRMAEPKRGIIILDGCHLSGYKLDALLRQPPVLVLEESTSALDLVTEERVLKSLADFCSQSVLIIISHRLSSISWMNRIVVLDAGRIVDIGPHDDLFSTSAFYRKLYVTNVDAINQPALGFGGPFEVSTGRRTKRFGKRAGWHS